jgi:rhodanese-related sulfurtransferase
MRSVVFAMFLVLFSMNSVASSSSAEVERLMKSSKLQSVDFKYVKSKIGHGVRSSAKALIIDARPYKKYQAGHIPTARAVPDMKFDKYAKEVLKDVSVKREIITYCGGIKCAKSVKVANKLKKMGFKNVKVYNKGMPDWKKNSYIEIDNNVAYAMFNNNKAVFVDARPRPKFLQSTIPGSMSIPDRDFDKLKGRLPIDKKQAMITFCGGYKCEKSHIVAKKLFENGYVNVKVLASGMPVWKKAKYMTTGGNGTIVKKAKKQPKKQTTFVKPGADAGTVDGDWFVKNYKSFPKNVLIVDSRAKDDYKKGHLKGAINIYSADLKTKEFVKMMPMDKEIIFYCASGNRSMEARMILEEAKFKNIDKVFYLDANIDFKNGKPSIKVNEPLGI